MDNPKYIPRIIDDTVKTYLSAFGAVCIEGPKWCGKSWTSSYHAKSEIYLGDPSNNFRNRNNTRINIEYALDGEKPHLIDEWQEVPEIWDAVRYRVDKSSENGNYILTGSATPAHKGIMHSGAGRIGKIRMRTMTLYEMGISNGQVSLKNVCNNEDLNLVTEKFTLKQIAEIIIRGGWPRNLSLPLNEASKLPIEYLNSIIDDDVYRIDEVNRDTKKMFSLLKSLARNESTTATKKVIMKDMVDLDDELINPNTASTYLDVFKRLFIIDDIPPFHPNVRSSTRVKQSDKHHLADTSLSCALLNLNLEGMLEDLETMGFLFEALCEHDLRIYAESFDAKLYHYQDYRNNEIDAVIEMPNGKWCAFEIKLGANMIDAAANNLLKIKKSFEEDSNGKPPSVLAVICGMTDMAYKRPDGVYVLPITALKP